MFKHLLSHKLAILFIIVLSLFISNSYAVEVQDLYVVTSPVKTQSKSVLKKAALIAFKEVLIRNSGSNAILEDVSVRKAYRKVTDYLQRFEYSKQENTNSVVNNAELEDFSPYLITLYFEPRLINELIQSAQMSLWGASRPLTTLWLVIEENNQRRVIKESLTEPVVSEFVPNNSGSIGGNIAEAINAKANSIEKLIFSNAQRRGIPVLIPLMDLEDELLVSISDIWGLFSSSIGAASLRYSADSSLFGRIRQDGVIWVGKFGFINQASEVNFELSNETKEGLITDMINKLSELLCEKYCVVEELGQKNEVVINISNIHSFKRFKLVESYLTSLASIRESELVIIEKTHIKLKLTLLGKISSLIDDIKLSQKMLLIEKPIEKLLKYTADSQLDLQQRNTELNRLELGETELDSLNFELDELETKVLNVERKKTNVNKDETNEKLTHTLYYRWVG